MHKWSPNCPWLIWVHFWARLWPSLTPPGNPVKFFGPKWLVHCTGVPHIVLHVWCSTRISGGYFWPSEVKFRGILVLKGNLFYICKNTKNVFFSNLAQQNVLIFEIWTLFYVLNHLAKSRKRLSLESNCSFKGGVLSCSFQYFLSKFRKSLLQLVCILFK